MSAYGSCSRTVHRGVHHAEVIMHTENVYSFFCELIFNDEKEVPPNPAQNEIHQSLLCSSVNDSLHVG